MAFDTAIALIVGSSPRSLSQARAISARSSFFERRRFVVSELRAQVTAGIEVLP